MIRLALLGDNPVATAVARAAATSPGFQLVRWAGRAQHLPAPLSHLPGLRLSVAWEELLTDSDVDAVVLATTDEDAEAIVRQLLQAGKVVLLLPELAQSTAFFYELALFEAEAPGKLFPLLDWRGHPLVLEAQRLIGKGELGRIRHVQFERTIATATAAADRSSAPGLMSQRDLANVMLIDSDLLRALFGPYNQVAASRSGDPGAGFSLATVTLAGSNTPQAVWTATSSATATGWKLTIFGEKGSAVLENCSPDPRSLRLSVQLPDQPPAVTEMTADSGAWLLEQFAAIRTVNAAADSVPTRPARLWDELACAVELVEGVERSIRRRRTIDVHFETPSERGIFKTHMTAVGCSLLMLTLAAAVLYLVFEASIELPHFLRQILVVLIFVPLGLFIVMQLLYFLTRPASRDQ
jgi:myo-inositol 2-dehydrogenase/D-chiro-inositol 1-dehydrogenase